MKKSLDSVLKIFLQLQKCEKIKFFLINLIITNKPYSNLLELIKSNILHKKFIHKRYLFKRKNNNTFVLKKNNKKKEHHYEEIVGASKIKKVNP